MIRELIRGYKRSRVAYCCAVACSEYVAQLITAALLNVKSLQEPVLPEVEFKVAFWTRAGIRYARLARYQKPFHDDTRPSKK